MIVKAVKNVTINKSLRLSDAKRRKYERTILNALNKRSGEILEQTAHGLVGKVFF